MFRRISLSLACGLAASSAQAFSETDIDPGFGNQQGWRRLFESGGGSQDEKAVALARTDDGGYVVALEVPGGGAAGGTGKRIGLFRLDRDGNPAGSGFGTNGRVFKDAWLTSVADMTIDAQGRIVVVGTTPGPGGLGDFGVVRFNPDGSDDTGFAGDGGAAFGFDGSLNWDDRPTSVLTEPDGRIVVAGHAQPQQLPSRYGVMRLNADGSLDATFGSIDDGQGGRRGDAGAFVDGEPAYAKRILRIAGGYYVLAGTTVYSASDTDFAMRILTPQGSQWANFVGSSRFAIDEPGPGGSYLDTLNDALLVDPTTILLVGTASGRFAATRVVAGTNDAGQYTTLAWDANFIGSAIPARPNRYVGDTSGSDGRSAALRADGRILLVGSTSSATVGTLRSGDDTPAGGVAAHAGLLTRLDPAGSPDTGFGIGGSVLQRAPSTGSPSYYTEFQQATFDSGKAVVIGSAVDDATSAQDFDGVVARLQSERIFADGFEAQP